MDPLPKDKAVLAFDGNTAHSSGYYFSIFGGCLYVGGRKKDEQKQEDEGRRRMKQEPRKKGAGRSKKQDAIKEAQRIDFLFPSY